jgi:hypothetical protein
MTHIPIPRIRDADPALLAGLREVDPSSELIYLGEKRWSLMRMRPLTDERIRGAERLLQATLGHSLKANTEDERRWYMRLRATRMHLMGYTVVSNWEFDGAPDARVLQDYRYRAWRLRRDEPYDDPEAEREANAANVHKDLYDPYLAKQMSKAARNRTSVTQI